MSDSTISTPARPVSQLPNDRARRLQAAIANLADQILIEEIPAPSLVELDALVHLCDELHLYAEAARVRRWMAAVDGR